MLDTLEAVMLDIGARDVGHIGAEMLDTFGAEMLDTLRAEMLDTDGAEMLDTDGSKHLKLVNGPGRCIGRVEIYYKGSWGTICDDSWDKADADVVCRQLGCGSAIKATTGAYYGRGTGNIWLDDVQCVGNETHILKCPASEFGQILCTHLYDAGGTRLQLVNGPGRCAGRVEIYHNRRWGTICQKSWDKADADVVCRQLDCGSAIKATTKDYYGKGTDFVWLADVKCVGNETNILNCPSSEFGQRTCSIYKNADKEMGGIQIHGSRAVGHTPAIVILTNSRERLQLQPLLKPQVPLQGPESSPPGGF
ncbi:unnamed protein product [Ranitomeya imitator]|uniref:SRCR domain-containing protein n=1 Tax=Ranitomeya imitator TaxID=111125 RepID=A0ABN9MM84_9NEOB|nr:unnamed protein product [Ranitomeya imitator]